MPFTFTPTNIADVIVIEPRVFPDERGFFMETYKYSEFAAHGIHETFVQGNQSHSERGILRGLHFQKQPKAQGKLVRAIAGTIFDVAVDLRRGAPSYGAWVGMELSAENKNMLYAPAGFAHGFCVVSAAADILYMTTAEYAPELESGIAWDDADLDIAWPVRAPQLSPRDRQWPRLRDADTGFVFHAG
ncbi:MAG TPA: dTDP-4-dehydrorhamnose 3,5-epimerase [Candidatus Limnocylindria bacterium]|nr:dTDP-4-dehydrorhamnose 3,5-epimerase [Candidatus Limnocylindria bacterium]